MQTSEVKAALRARFCSPEWALFFEVADATGARHNRWADAVAMNLWPSRGLAIHGMEVKVSRSDWLRELKDPSKSAPVQRYCDHWWIVAPAGVLKDGELPPTWGHYEVKPGGTLRELVAAPKLESEAVTRQFVAALMRRASAADEGIVAAAVGAEIARLREGDEKRIKREVEHRTGELEDLRKQIADIERVSGVEIRRWSNSEEIGRAVKAVLACGAMRSYGGIAALRKNAESILACCDEALALFPGTADDEIDSDPVGASQ
ncbi:hypothetical protein [Burkholderia cenocepacia]|uniref:hypothetical protein n=1 Tax=Burkholderia cenocepacia TaxID=95486 RepID=UPI00264C1AAB|nr:hypothetical protein [Burkholderia cenocepacia]MDN7456538.1 hypothetical protein [Burkholderia cenocepacia]